MVKVSFEKEKNKMKKFLVSMVAVFAATSAFAADPIFGPAKPPVKEGTGTFKAQSYGLEVKSVNDVKFVGIYDNKNGNGAIQKKLQSQAAAFRFQSKQILNRLPSSITLAKNGRVRFQKIYFDSSSVLFEGAFEGNWSLAK